MRRFVQVISACSAETIHVTAPSAVVADANRSATVYGSDETAPPNDESADLNNADGVTTGSLSGDGDR